MEEVEHLVLLTKLKWNGNYIKVIVVQLDLFLRKPLVMVQKGDVYPERVDDQMDLVYQKLLEIRNN